MRHISQKIRNDSGSAGKGFLIFFATVLLLGVAVYVLWKPVFLPLVGEAIPERVTESTAFSVPGGQQDITFQVPPEWVIERGLFNQNIAQIISPDLTLSIKVETWKSGTGPSLGSGLKEVLAGAQESEQPHTEIIAPGVLFHYATAVIDGQEMLVGTVGVEKDLSTKTKAAAVIFVSVTDADLEEYLPTLSNILRNVQVKS